MYWPPIKKTPDNLPLPPHLLDYHKTCADFSWTAVRRELTAAEGGTRLNMAFEAVDRHASSVRANQLALRWLGDDGVSLDLTYCALQEQTNRFANLLQHLRAIYSAGEHPNPEAVVWGQNFLGWPIHDNWWQTETGGIMIANYLAQEIRPGSMGRPLPGIETAIVHQHNDALEIEEKPNVQGELALRSEWPSMFRGYLHEKERYRKSFIGEYCLTGDLAWRDADGYFWFAGGANDIITSAGHLVSPLEVESALMTHPAVAEAGVIGIPHSVTGGMVKAFIALKPGSFGTDRFQ